MNDCQNKVYDLVRIAVDKRVQTIPLSDIQIEQLVNFFSETPLIDSVLTESEKLEVIKEFKRNMDVSVEKGKSTFLCDEDFKSWYYSAKAQNDNNIFWNRYYKYLVINKKYNSSVVNSIDKSTDEIMDLIGNPRLGKGISFMRRGLVLGDVQSGKTGTYIGLINKAADAGYKVIILLTGVIEKLRQQTQERVDEGFLGTSSASLVKNKKNSETIGVGKYGKASTFCLTTTEADFNTGLANNVIGSIDSINCPIILVIKKNKSVLTKLYQWFSSRNNLKDGEKLDYPLLLIDDEADNASINTNSEDTNPTAINKCIREILSLFTKSNYVGFTATPYANIFIKPDNDEDMDRADLFPKNFIYVLKRPSNYVGPEGIFLEDGKYSYMLKNIDDSAENEFLPENHKRITTVNEELPTNLQEAICSFFIANAIRDLRKHENTHRSMLINISRFIDVQNNIADVIDSFVKRYQRILGNYSKASNPLSHEEIFNIYNTYKKHFEFLPHESFENDDMFSWEDILGVLYRSTAPIIVKAINKGNASKNLNYADCPDGLRIIAVGGFSLSRGLTLEGLCTSYYYRNSKMYDTLMQMGRWFGYRDHYADLCQIWLNETTRDWYQQVTVATKELKEDISRMENLKKTPKDFGLWVRSDCTALYVTAKNKMRNSETIVRKITFSGKIIETPYIKRNQKENDQLRQNTKSFIDSLIDLIGGFSSDKGLTKSNTPIFKDVPVQKIIDFLPNISLSGEKEFVETDALVEYIKNSNTFYEKWDVAIATGEGDKYWTFGDIEIKNVLRSFRISKYSYVISGKSSRVGDTSMYGLGLTSDEYNRIRIEKKNKTDKELSQSDLFAAGIVRNPLLVIYPIQLKLGEKDKSSSEDYENKKEIIEKFGKKPLIAFGIGFPWVKGEQSVQVKYQMNMRRRDEILGVDKDYSNTDQEEDIDD